MLNGPDLLEERYKQLETNFKAIVQEIKGRPSSERQLAACEALLTKHDSDLRHALLRAQASNMAAHQRLEERTAILQRNFTRVVELMGEPATSPSSAKRLLAFPRWNVAFLFAAGSVTVCCPFFAKLLSNLTEF